MPFDPNKFPMVENAITVKKVVPGAVIVIPKGTMCPLEVGRVVEVIYGKPGGTMLVHVEPVD